MSKEGELEESYLNPECGEIRDRVQEYLSEYDTLTARAKQKEAEFQKKIQELPKIMPMYPLPEELQHLQKEIEVLDRSKEMLARKAMNGILKLRAKGCKVMQI